MKNNQNGMAHIAILFGGFLIVGLIGFTGFRVVNKQSNSQIGKANETQSTGASEKSPASVTAEQTAEAVQSAAPTAPKTTPSANPPAPQSAPQKRTITFTKGGGSQNGDVVSVSANLSENQTGTCTYTFSLNGTERVKQTSAISNSNVCSKNIPVSDFPKSATYSFTLNYLSSDGLVSAHQSAYDIEVH